MQAREASPRDLTKSWCPEGEPLAEAVAQIPAEAWERRTAAFDGVDKFEARAALFLHAFTGYMPRLEDTDGRQGAVDLTLHVADRLVGIVEVTSTLDAQFQRNSAHLQPLIDEVNREYRGDARWALSFEHGWRLPPGRQRSALARELASGLEMQESSTNVAQAIQIANLVLAYPISDPGDGAVELTGWNANIPDARDLPYLDRLTAYLSSSTLVARKLKKLSAEAERLGTTRCHLYLLMASTGNEGGLFPVSPSYFTWGNFSCPEPATDLWLDGGTGEVYHWDLSSGWKFHRL
jgi:hypothetical protein